MRRIATSLLLGLVLIGGCTVRFAGQRDADWDRSAVDSKEIARELNVTLPAYPRDADLVEFFPGALGSHRYYIDANSLAIGADGIVRYAAVVKSEGGAINTTYEGIRCQTREKRIYALGHPQRKWIEAKYSSWQPIVASRRNEYQVTLYSDYFCPNRFVVNDRETVLRALRAGLHGFAPKGAGE